MCTVGYIDISAVVRQQVESERLVGAFPLLTTCTTYKHLSVYTLRLIE